MARLVSLTRVPWSAGRLVARCSKTCVDVCDRDFPALNFKVLELPGPDSGRVRPRCCLDGRFAVSGGKIKQRPGLNRGSTGLASHIMGSIIDRERRYAFLYWFIVGM